MSYRPHMLVKVRSEALMDAIGGMPCTARIAGLVPGHRCAPANTVVGAHVGRLGKGVATKVSDLNVIAACLHCHQLIDGVDARIWALLKDQPATTLKRLIDAQHETWALLVQAEIITVKGATLI